MSVRRCVVGIGQRAAGDDGVGLCVLDELERRAVPANTALIRLADPLGLVGLLEAHERVVLVDALLAEPPGQVLELAPDELSSVAAQPASSHGLGAAQAIELARALEPDRAIDLCIVAVSISRPERYGTSLSSAVAAAVPRAADKIIELLGP